MVRQRSFVVDSKVIFPAFGITPISGLASVMCGACSKLKSMSDISSRPKPVIGSNFEQPLNWSLRHSRRASRQQSLRHFFRKSHWPPVDQ
jgi:hypothetical protein